MYHPSLEEIKKYGQGKIMVPVYREMIADLETPVSAFMKIQNGGNSFLLESVEGGQKLARYSFIGTEPYKTISSSEGSKVDLLKQINQELGEYKIKNIEGLPRFCGGAVGYLSYEAASTFEDIPTPQKDSLKLPKSLFMLTDTLLVFDHIKHMIKIISYVRLDGDVEESYKKAISKIEELIRRLKNPIPPQKERPPQDKTSSYDITSNTSKEDFIKRVEKIKKYITEGEAIQVVLSQRLMRKTNATPFEIYRALRTINPSPYMFYLEYNSFQIIGASPEILVRVEGGNVMTRPLAGTRPRSKNKKEDKELEKELLQDEKERAEHVMLVDLGRNDIGRVAEPGSVKVSDLMNVERYSHVMHLVSHVQGKLRSDMTSLDALKACFPAGTVSGAPKIKAMEIIAELEEEKRGPYAGAAGYLSFSGNMDMAIAIRTMVMKDQTVYMQAGCGVVYDSVPENEYQESLNKAKVMIKAVQQAERS